MNSDDEKRIRERHKIDHTGNSRKWPDGHIECDVCELLAKLDESERFRTKAERRVGEMQEMVSESERARKAVETTLAEMRTTYAENAYRIVRAEAALAEERQMHLARETTLTEALMNSDRALAKERAKREAAEEQTSLMAGSHASMVTSKATALKLGVEFKARAEVAEARVRELEAAIQCGGKTPAEGG